MYASFLKDIPPSAIFFNSSKEASFFIKTLEHYVKDRWSQGKARDLISKFHFVQKGSGVLICKVGRAADNKIVFGFA